MVSNFFLRVGMLMPFAALAAFVLGNCCSWVFSWPGIAEGDPLDFMFLRSQKEFLMNRGVAASDLNIGFRIFGMFIWTASVVGLLRILTALCARGVLGGYREKLDGLKKAGRSTGGVIATLLLIGPFAIFCSTNFEFSSGSDQVRFLIVHSPNAFLCLVAFVFCTGVIFSAEGLLFLVWILLFSRSR